MDLLEILREAAESPNTKYTEFLQQYKFDKETIHLFFEGNDDQSFYMNYVNHILPKHFKIYSYVCQGKGKVHTVYNQINWLTYSKNRVLFFTDKDFSTVLNQSWTADENIFTTKHYSVENYICSPTMIERILREILHINDPKLIKKFCNHFVKEETNFENLILPLTATIIMLIRAGNDVPLKDFNLSAILKLDDNLAIKKINGVKISQYLQRTTHCIIPHNSWKTILKICKELKRDYSREDYIRGKFSLWFLVNITRKIPDRINHFKKSGNTELKCSIFTHINVQNAVEILGPRVPIPDDIKEFLEYNAQRLNWYSQQ